MGNRRGKMPSDTPQISIVVPTLKEAGNISPLISGLSAAIEKVGLRWEVLIVDDNSQDGTAEICQILAGQGYPLRLLVRKNQHGLATAVAHGLARARAKVLLVMDADLSHPFSSIQAFYEAVQGGFDFVVGSRYIPGAETDDRWTVYRYVNSKLACLLARPLTDLSDPMSGFFAMTRTLWENCRDLSPVGYKIGLEIMIKGRPGRIKELPIHFKTRVKGQSKLTIKQQWLYLVHLVSLYRYMWRARRRRDL